MTKTMSLAARNELLSSARSAYQQASRADKTKLLDGLVAVTGYDRKYAIQRLGRASTPKTSPRPAQAVRYNAQIRNAVIVLWRAANKICSKRLVPFLPELVAVMEKHGHLRLTSELRVQLLRISPATVDRILYAERQTCRRSHTTTQHGSLLKHQIHVRTFADWDDVTPGFIEADLVAHCGGNTNGAFLNTLTLVDICTGWVECLPLMRKSAQNVIDGLQVARGLMPFPLQGLDTDCGSEFINHDLLNYCEAHHITFTRARTHRKNDQAHVEEKNGSVVRKLVGYDRFEGRAAWQALAELYRVLRQYVNFFQPSLKLLRKERTGAKVRKAYDAAKTPYQRILLSPHISAAKRAALTQEYQSLDPVVLLSSLQRLQDQLWQYSSADRVTPDNTLAVAKAMITRHTAPAPTGLDNHHRFYRSSKMTDRRKSPRTWRTRKDSFASSWDQLRLRLELNPELNAKELMAWLITKHPNDYALGQTRTLQRRIAQWRQQQLSQEREMRALLTPTTSLRSTATSEEALLAGPQRLADQRRCED